MAELRGALGITALAGGGTHNLTQIVKLRVANAAALRHTRLSAIYLKKELHKREQGR